MGCLQLFAEKFCVLSCAMPIGRKDAERGLELLWEFRSKTDDPIQRSAYEQAIASLHAFLTDVLPASQPCVRAKVKDGFVELHPTQEAPVQVVELKCVEGEKIGLFLDRVNGWGVDEVSSIVIGLVKRGSVAARDSTLKRGDQVLEVNGHSLAQVSLDRARSTPPLLPLFPPLSLSLPPPSLPLPPAFLPTILCSCSSIHGRQQEPLVCKREKIDNLD